MSKKITAEYEDRYIIGTGESAGFDANHAWNTVRGGGIGSDAWVARLTGTHPTYRFERAFMSLTKDNRSKSRRSGGMAWELDGDGVYEFRHFAASSSYPASGYVQVSDGRVRRLTMGQAKALLDGDAEDLTVVESGQASA